MSARRSTVFAILTFTFMNIASAAEKPTLPPIAPMISFNLKDLPGSVVTCVEGVPQPDAKIEALTDTVNNPKFWSELTKKSTKDKNDKERLGEVFYLFPKEDEGKEITYDGPTRTLGMTEQEALYAARDAFNTESCTPEHIHDDIANRWCHSSIARTFTSFLESKGLNPVLASVFGGVFWLPKEYFVDLNPSANDLVITYADKLGTKRTTFEITVFGDAIWKKYPGKDVTPFKGSMPFITIRRKLGPAPK